MYDHQVVDEFMIVMAFRYALGRMSTAPWHMVSWLRRNWLGLTEPTRKLIMREVEEAFARDDRARLIAAKKNKLGASYPLGMDCDRAEWDKVRSWGKKSHDFNRIK